MNENEKKTEPPSQKTKDVMELYEKLCESLRVASASPLTIRNGDHRDPIAMITCEGFCYECGAKLADDERGRGEHPEDFEVCFMCERVCPGCEAPVEKAGQLCPVCADEHAEAMEQHEREHMAGRV